MGAPMMIFNNNKKIIIIKKKVKQYNNIYFSYLFVLERVAVELTGQERIICICVDLVIIDTFPSHHCVCISKRVNKTKTTD